MPGYRRFLASSVSFLVLIIFLMSVAGSVSAQTAAQSPVPSAATLKERAASIEQTYNSTITEQISESARPQPSSQDGTTAAASATPVQERAAAEPAIAVVEPAAKADSGNVAANPALQAQCKRTILADVVALPQPIMLNRLGAAMPGGVIFSLKRDTQGTGVNVTLKAGKRPRPLVLRANVGDCLKITFTNSIPLEYFRIATIPPPAPVPPFNTSEVSIHVQGLEWVTGSQDDGSFVGRNATSLANAVTTSTPGETKTYTLFARAEGTYLLYTMGDTSTVATQLANGLFGAVNIQPAGAEWYRSQVSATDLLQATYHTSRLGGATLKCNTKETDCTLTLSQRPLKQVKVKKTPAGYLYTMDNHPLINYNAAFADGTPVLKMLNAQNQLVYSDLTAMITGPNAGRFPGTTGVNRPEPACNAENNPALNPPPGGRVDPLFCANPASPDRKQPYREITIIYHGGLGGPPSGPPQSVVAQAFPAFLGPPVGNTLVAGQDAFAINYGTGGIGAEVYANRIGVGPMGDCVDCKFEEFFLSAWTVADPAMIVDKPANSNSLTTQPRSPTTNNRFVAPCDTTAKFEDFASADPQIQGCHGTRTPATGFPYTMKGRQKATAAFFPEDPSNVYHSYINDHVKFRILHAGRDVSHVHHQHAHQWLQSPNSDQGSYLDSQMISPGASYTLEMVYNGSGNRNKVVGDSIFHCHFYPHFAAGMWAMWRTHDTFESGTYVLKNGQAVAGSRALPDGEIIAGVPTPGIVPMPTLPMAPLPGYAQIQNNVPVNGVTIPYGGQIVIGGVCQSNKINNLDVIGGCTNGQVLNGTVINSDFDGTTMTGQFQPSTGNALINPGYPYFIPGVAGARAPHPPMDFAPDGAGFMDGGLPRHVITGGSIKVESHDAVDWSKDVGTADAHELPEGGTKVENAAIDFFRKRCYPTFFPDGTPGSCPSSVSTPPQSTLNTPPTGFVVNGLPLGPQLGAPFADPAVDDNGKPVGLKRTYKAAAFQFNVTLNKKGWHFPQQRMLSLWQDVQPTIDFSNGKPGRQPEPFFFRGNTGDIIEYWHTNLVPNYYLVDDFQVRTPTDILGQHIHLVKFDVTSSDGAGNGFNYEDGTFSPEEVQELIHAINAGGGLLRSNGTKTPLGAPKPPPAEIFNCAANPTALRCQPCPETPTPDYPQCMSWLGAQTTIQRWYLDPLVDDSGVDRTLRTVFTHDHFGPSTHQQAGLYAGLVVEPMGSSWRNSEDGSIMGRPADQPPIRPDGGPTSWKADILTRNAADSYREFVLEFQDLQLAYESASTDTVNPPITKPSADPKKGWMDPAYAINAPSASKTTAAPNLISTGMSNVPPGTQSVNYLNEPIAWRVGRVGVPGDMSYAYDSSFKLAPNLPPNGDPITPLMRAYQNDNVQVRTLVGAHVFSHQFNLEGPTWFSEPSWKNSGYRSAQAMGLSEHFELLFKVPPSSAPSGGRKCPDGMSEANCVDYLYSPSLDISGVANGMWGLFRSYDPTVTATKLQPLPSNPVGPTAPVSYTTCPGPVNRVFNITAVTSQKALSAQSSFPGTVVFNSRGNPLEILYNENAVMYVRTEDLKNGLLRKDVPVEPLILRANAGDCIEINLTNDIDPNSSIFRQDFFLAPPFDVVSPADNQPVYQSKMSSYVGLHPQLLSYDAAKSYGFNVGWNAAGQPQGQAVGFGQTIKYQWYAGKIDRAANGTLTHTPVEFGTLNLFPSDPVFQHLNGLFGSMIIEPPRATWTCGEPGRETNCEPAGDDPRPTTRASARVTLADGTFFREFVAMISDNIRMSPNPDPKDTPNSSAVNYRTEPWKFRYAHNSIQDFSCMLSNELVGGDPQTPIFAAGVGDKVRFRLAHPFGTGTSQVFSLHGHVWQRNPYKADSTQIGDNPLSQWIGSRDNHGSTDHFDLIVDKAGGEGGQAGDYLYTVFQFLQARVGAWGVFRVGDVRERAPSNNPACKVIQAPYSAPEPVGGVKPFVRPSLNTAPKQ